MRPALADSTALACLRLAGRVAASVARLAPGWGDYPLRRAGFAPAGRLAEFHEFIAFPHSFRTSLSWSHYFTCVHPSTAAREVLSRPEFSSMCIDAGRDFPRFIEVLFESFRATVKARRTAVASHDVPTFASNAAPSSPATVTTARSNDHTSAPDVRPLVMISASTQPIPRRASRRRFMKERTSS